jgi:hypothetical protein
VDNHPFEAALAGLQMTKRWAGDVMRWRDNENTVTQPEFLKAPASVKLSSLKVFAKNNALRCFETMSGSEAEYFE